MHALIAAMTIIFALAVLVCVCVVDGCWWAWVVSDGCVGPLDCAAALRRLCAQDQPGTSAATSPFAWHHHHRIAATSDKRHAHDDTPTTHASYPLTCRVVPAHSSRTDHGRVTRSQPDATHRSASHRIARAASRTPLPAPAGAAAAAAPAVAAPAGAMNLVAHSPGLHALVTACSTPSAAPLSAAAASPRASPMAGLTLTSPASGSKPQKPITVRTGSDEREGTRRARRAHWIHRVAAAAAAAASCGSLFVRPERTAPIGWRMRSPV